MATTGLRSAPCLCMGFLCARQPRIDRVCPIHGEANMGKENLEKEKGEFMEELQIMAMTAAGLESVVGQEVRELGYEPNVENGKVCYSGDAMALVRSNLWLRTADRIRVNVGEFDAVTFEELFEGAKRLPWWQWLPKNAQFPVEGKSVKSTLFSVSDCQAIVKKAIVESLKTKYKLDWFPEDGPLFRIEVALLKDRVTLTLDASGSGMHRRGYKQLVGEAPLRETMAAGLILLSRWQPDTTLVDPFCGSGTIPIEAALIGRRMAPGLSRSFACEQWSWVPASIVKQARQEAEELAEPKRPLDIIGTDADDGVIKVARRNAEKAGVADTVHFQTLKMEDLRSSRRYGKVITNPPYGERLGEAQEASRLYKELGQVLQSLDTWSFYVLTSHPKFETWFGRRASKKRKLYNGSLRVDYYQFYGPRPPRRARP